MSKNRPVSMDRYLRLPRGPGTVDQQSRIFRSDGGQSVCYGCGVTHFQATVEVGRDDLNRPLDMGHHFLDQRVVLALHKYDLRVTMIQRVRQLGNAGTHVEWHRDKASVHR